jgi:antitoxin component of MazEF toxin-antitoxin module
MVKVRRVGQTLVVTLTQEVLRQVPLVEGDRVLIEPLPPRRIILSKEEKTMPTTKRLELELGVLKSKLKSKESSLTFLETQHNLDMPVEDAATDDKVFELTMRQLVRDRDQVAMEIAEKELSLFDAQGA